VLPNRANTNKGINFDFDQVLWVDQFGDFHHG
jgi:hypothetical protein